MPIEAHTTAADVEDVLLATILDEDLARRACTFEDAGIMTTDRGLVLTMADGTEFQVTIVRSR